MQSRLQFYLICDLQDISLNFSENSFFVITRAALRCSCLRLELNKEARYCAFGTMFRPDSTIF